VKLTYNNPAFEKGLEIDLPGIGLIKNGEPFEVDEDQEAAYKDRTGNSLAEVAKKDDNFEKAKGGKN
jgi:hypothetical protein